MKQNISPIKQRILQFIDSKRISKRNFYANAGISRGTLESPTGITEDIMAKCLAAYPEIDIIWLVTGKEKPPEVIVPELPQKCDKCDLKDELIETQRRYIQRLENDLRQQPGDAGQKRKAG